MSNAPGKPAKEMLATAPGRPAASNTTLPGTETKAAGGVAVSTKSWPSGPISAEPVEQSAAPYALEIRTLSTLGEVVNPAQTVRLAAMADFCA